MEKSKCNSWIILKVKKIKPDTLEEDCPSTTFSEKRRFYSFFANGPNKFKAQLCNC